MRGPFVRRRNGEVDVTLTQVEVDLIRSVVDQMVQVLELPPAGRLFPPAYRDDLEAQEEYARLMTAELAEGKRRAVRSVQATLGRGRAKRDSWSVRLSAEEADDWLAVLNDARLTLGTRLDITEDSYERDIDPGDPDAAAHEVFRYLGYVEDSLVQTMLAGLDD
ncbi:MAG: DUF2017 family protein [Actinomycetota bacterium]